MRYLTNYFSKCGYKEIGIPSLLLLLDTGNCRAWFLDLRGFFAQPESTMRKKTNPAEAGLYTEYLVARDGLS